MMLRLGKIFIVIVLVCIVKKTYAESAFYSREWSSPSNTTKFLRPGKLYVTDEIIYPSGDCENTIPRKEITCTVRISQMSYPDKTCSGIKILASEDKEILEGGFFDLIPVTENYVVIGYYEVPKEPENTGDKVFNIIILDARTCNTVRKSFPVDEVDYDSVPALVLYQDQVTIILPSKSKCKGEKMCKISFDYEGKKVGGSRSYQAGISQYAAPVAAGNPEKGFYVTSNNLKTLKTLLVQKSGKSKMLKTENLDSDADEELVSFSNSHGIFTVCHMPVKASGSAANIYCSQFNGEGNTIIDNATIPMEKSVGWIAARSLNYGGIVLGTSSCSKSEAQPNGKKDFVVVNIQTDGSVVKTVNWQGPEFQCNNKDTGLEVRLSERGRDEFCFDFSYQQSNNTLKYHSICRKDQLLIDEDF